MELLNENAKFKCNDCGKVFDEPKILYDFVPYGNRYVRTACSPQSPCCDSSFEVSYPCEECGEYFTEYELEDGYCQECLEELERNNGST